MERFVRRENVKHYGQLLKTAKTEAERQQILKLLAEEQEKQRAAGDELEGQRQGLNLTIENRTATNEQDGD